MEFELEQVELRCLLDVSALSTAKGPWSHGMGNAPGMTDHLPLLGTAQPPEPPRCSAAASQVRLETLWWVLESQVLVHPEAIPTGLLWSPQTGLSRLPPLHLTPTLPVILSPCCLCIFLLIKFYRGDNC